MTSSDVIYLFFFKREGKRQNRFKSLPLFFFLFLPARFFFGVFHKSVVVLFRLFFF